jgi:hypothetical protein
MNVYLPIDYKIMVLEGQRVIGGETILAFFESDEKIFTDFD